MKKRDKLHPGVYIITNIVNNKIYIGSTKRFKERFRGHRSLLNRNVHFSSHLQNSWNKYGGDKFTFEILYEIPKEEFSNITELELDNNLIKIEEEYIKKYNSTDRLIGYNTRSDCSTNSGLKWPEESKRKFSESKKGKPLPKAALEALAIHRESITGKPNEAAKKWYASLSDEERQRRTEMRTKNVIAANAKKIELYGKSRSPETEKKMKESKQRSGRVKLIQTYNLDGSFDKLHQSYSEGAVYVGRPSGSGTCCENAAKMDFYLVGSYGKLEQNQ